MITPALCRLLQDIRERDEGARLGVSVEPSHVRAVAVQEGLIKGRKMKVGHRKLYSLTSAGWAAIGEKQ